MDREMRKEDANKWARWPSLTESYKMCSPASQASLSEKTLRWSSPGRDCQEGSSWRPWEAREKGTALQALPPVRVTLISAEKSLKHLDGQEERWRSKKWLRAGLGWVIKFSDKLHENLRSGLVDSLGTKTRD